MATRRSRQSLDAPQRNHSDAEARESAFEAHDGSDIDSRIRKRAYELYLARGSHPGDEIDDWLQAEDEVREHADAGAAGDA